MDVNSAGMGALPPASGTAGGPYQVAIEVSTIPHGGAVYLDSLPLAQPRVVLSMSDQQEHDIVARAGCRQAVAAMTAADLASFDGPLVLELQPRIEDVRIGSDPPGARIYLDSRNTRKKTPATVTMKACAERTIQLRREGYREWKATYDSETDFDQMMTGLEQVPLDPIPSGEVLVDRPPEYSVEIFKGKRRLGRAGKPFSLLEGKYTLTFRNDKHFMSKKLQVTVQGGKTNTPLVSFPGLGSLTVHAQPSNCKVYIDGAYVDVTPLIDLPIAAGGHRVKVVFVPNGSSREIAVAIDAGQNERVVVKF